MSGALDLEGFHASLGVEEAAAWFAGKLQRKPTSGEVYTVAKDFYHRGQFQEAARALELYAGLPGRQLAGLHLLGYAYYMSHDLSRALETFKLCVNEGFDADWQLLIELQQEQEADTRQQAASPR